MAQDEKTIIRSVLDPQITLDLLQMEDAFQATNEKMPENRKNDPTGRQVQNEVGTMYPFISINGYVLKQSEISIFRIETRELLPTLFLEFDLFTTNAFTTASMPKDGDLVNVFMRAKNDAFKPIRNDYLITSINVGGGGVESMGGKVTIRGELFIPTIRDEVVKSYTGNSIDVLKQIAKDLKMGFATNETSTVDSQAWICPGDSLFNLINQIGEHAWKSPKDFYKVYVDVYYHLNFVNMNNQFEGNNELAAGILDIAINNDYYPNEKGVVEETQAGLPKCLTDLENFQGTNFFIKQKEIKNNSSEVARKFGYKTHVQFFDLKSLKYWDLYVDPITTEGSENNKIILKGRTFPKESNSTEEGAPSQETWWKTQNKKMWLGIQSKNVHDNYLFSEIHNKRNLAEIDKMFIEVDLARWNPNFFNGEKVPIILLNLNDELKRNTDAIGPSAEANIGEAMIPSIDQFYTGYYVLDGMKLSYGREGMGATKVPPGAPEAQENKPPQPDFKQTFILRRREWPAP